MVTPSDKKSSKAHQIDHLMAQREHLLVMQAYLEWKIKPDHSNIASMYRSLADLLEQAAEEYQVLVGMLQEEVNQESDH